MSMFSNFSAFDQLAANLNQPMTSNEAQFLDNLPPGERQQANDRLEIMNYYLAEIQKF